MKDYLERNATELSLRGLGLRPLPAQLPPCRRLNIDDNCLTSLRYSLSDSIEKLSASRNKIVTLPDEWPPTLKELTLENNCLEIVPIHLMNNLTRVSLSGNENLIIKDAMGVGKHLILSSLPWITYTQLKFREAYKGDDNASIQNTNIICEVVKVSIVKNKLIINEKNLLFLATSQQDNYRENHG